MRVTEMQHPRTLSLDTASPSQFIAQMDAAGLEIFGSQWGLGLWDPEVLAALELGQTWVAETLANPRGRVLMGGAGTSGRLALLAARAWDQQAVPAVVGLMAGGRSAFFQAQEGAEDSACAGISDLEAQLTGDGPRLYIGISCGLSANYVAGQMQRILSHPNSRVIVLGFNPREEASRGLDSERGLSFADALAQVRASQRGLEILPSIGPEPVTGSTRLKCGTATHLVLHLLLHSGSVRQALQIVERAYRDWVRADSKALAAAIQVAGQTLREGGNLRYSLAGEAAWFAILDASECSPTFGAKPGQCEAEWDAQLFSAWKMGPDLLRFATKKPPQKGDTSFFGVFQQDDDSSFVCIYSEQKSVIAAYKYESCRLDFNGDMILLKQLLVELSMKRVLNLISTGSFVFYGKIVDNLMIDLRISNLKLLNRALNIIGKMANCDFQQARLALLSVLGFRSNSFPTDQDLIKKAFSQERVIPRSILVAALGDTPEAACSKLQEVPHLKNWLKLKLDGLNMRGGSEL